MNLKTSITIIIGCLVIFLFVMLPIFLSIEKKENEYVKKFQGSSFCSIDKNIGSITNRKIIKQPIITVIEVFKFIVAK